MKLIRFKRQLAAYYHHKHPERSAVDIGDELGYSSRWVTKWWNKNDEEPEEFKDNREGRDMSSISKINPTVERMIVKNMHGAKKFRGGFRRKLSQRKMVKHLEVKHNIHVNRITIGRILKKNGLIYQLLLKEDIRVIDEKFLCFGCNFEFFRFFLKFF
jgi:hypothetical protein